MGVAATDDDVGPSVDVVQLGRSEEEDEERVTSRSSAAASSAGSSPRPRTTTRAADITAKAKADGRDLHRGDQVEDQRCRRRASALQLS